LLFEPELERLMHDHEEVLRRADVRGRVRRRDPFLQFQQFVHMEVHAVR
jgi:hypothetical protein